jgi:hypothetical protein
MVNNLSLSDVWLTPQDSNVEQDWELSPTSSGSTSSTEPYVYGPITNENYNNSDHNSDHFGGNLYSYTAATAGQNPSSGSATSDICSKNWKMPNQSDMINMVSQGKNYLQPTGQFAGVFSGQTTMVFSISLVLVSFGVLP